MQQQKRSLVKILETDLLSRDEGFALSSVKIRTHLSLIAEVVWIYYKYIGKFQGCFSQKVPLVRFVVWWEVYSIMV